MCLTFKVNSSKRVLSEGFHEGFEWTTVHNGIGYRCGYVRIPLGHPWHGKSYEDEVIDSINVHGGITFAEAHVPYGEPGEDNGWWLGFDCAHLGDAQDLSLPCERILSYCPGTIKDQAYVEAECKSLCEQALKQQVRSLCSSANQKQNKTNGSI
jgi:hypothetical protein